MSNENLPSITTRNDDPGGERSSFKKEKAAALFARAVNGMMDLKRIENGELDKIDLENMIEETEKMVLKKKKDVKKMYSKYQILWTSFVANNNISNEYNDVALVRFFKSIQGRYSPNTLWVVYSCLNSRFIDNYGVNLKGLARLHKYLKQQTQLPSAQKRLIQYS